MCRTSRPLVLSAVLAGVALCSACAGAPPLDAMARAGAAVDAARMAGAVEYAPAELNHARVELARARVLTDRGQHADARGLADAADRHAQAARRRALDERARRSMDDAEPAPAGAP